MALALVRVRGVSRDIRKHQAPGAGLRGIIPMRGRSAGVDTALQRFGSETSIEAEVVIETNIRRKDLLWVRNEKELQHHGSHVQPGE